MLISSACSRRWCDDLLRVAGEPQDVKPAAGAVRSIDQAAVVDLDVVGDAGGLALAGRRLGAEFTALSRFGVLAGWHRELVRRRNEVGDLVNGKRISNV